MNNVRKLNIPLKSECRDGKVKLHVQQLQKLEKKDISEEQPKPIKLVKKQIQETTMKTQLNKQYLRSLKTLDGVFEKYCRINPFKKKELEHQSQSQVNATQKEQEIQTDVQVCLTGMDDQIPPDRQTNKDLNNKEFEKSKSSEIYDENKCRMLLEQSAQRFTDQLIDQCIYELQLEEARQQGTFMIEAIENIQLNDIANDMAEKRALKKHSLEMINDEAITDSSEKTMWIGRREENDDPLIDVERDHDNETTSPGNMLELADDAVYKLFADVRSLIFAKYCLDK